MTTRPNRRWLQFSLRTFLIVLTLLAMGLGYVSFRAREQREAVARINELGGHIQYDYQRGSNPKPSPPGWPWLRRLVGDEYFQDVAFVNLGNTKVSDADLRLISKLRRTKILTLDGTNISDEGLASIRGMSELQSLGLMKTKVTTEGIRRMRPPRTGSTVRLAETSIGDDALPNLSSCGFLILDGTAITSQGVQKLAESKTLIDFSIQRTAVDDAAVPSLVKIKTLTWLLVWDTKISGEGLFRLRNALPNCHVDGPVVDFSGGFNPAAPGPEGGGWKPRMERLLWLNKAQHLKLVVLADPLVTDGHLATLEGLDHLELLDLRGASVTDAGVKRLQKALPKLKIHR